MDDPPGSSAIGSLGFLSIGTRGRNGPGEVLVKIRGGSEAYLAWSDDPLPKGSAVLIMEARGARTVFVVPWSDTGTTAS